MLRRGCAGVCLFGLLTVGCQAAPGDAMRGAWHGLQADLQARAAQAPRPVPVWTGGGTAAPDRGSAVRVPASDDQGPLMWRLAQATTAPAQTRPRDIPEGSFWRAWKTDAKRWPGELWTDTQRLFNFRDGAILLVAGGASLAVRETVDDDVDDWVRESPNRWGKFQDFTGAIGNPGHHFAAAAVLYWYGIEHENTKAYQCAKSMTNVLIINAMGTVLLKAAADTESPNGEDWGWPSGHTSSSVAMASVLDEYYGPWAGIPAYLLAGLVSWGRIDDSEHSVSDVVFGAALGWVIGHTVGGGRKAELFGMQVTPFVDIASGAAGIALRKRF